jgi:hypothetical protein
MKWDLDEFNRAAEEAWTEALRSYRAQGIDPREVIRKAAQNLEQWRGKPPSSLPPPDGEL